MIHFNFKIIVKKSLLAIEQVIFMNSKNGWCFKKYAEKKQVEF